MVLLSLGVPKMGKTQCLLDYAGPHSLTHRFFVVDRAGDWLLEADRWRGLEFQPWDSKQRGMFDRLLIRGGPELAALLHRGPTSHRWYGLAPAPTEDVSSWLSTLPPTGVFVFPWPWEGEEVAELVKMLGNTTYVDDEIDLVAVHGGWAPNKFGVGGNPLRDFCHRGRHLPNAAGEVGQVHILGAARQPQSLHPNMTGLADQVWVFRVQGHHTLDRLESDRILTPEEIDLAVNLPPYHFKSWQASGDSAWGKLAPL